MIVFAMFKGCLLSNVWCSVTVLAFHLEDSKDINKGDEYSIDDDFTGRGWTLGVAMDVSFDDIEFSLCDSCALLFLSSSTRLLQWLYAVHVTCFVTCVCDSFCAVSFDGTCVWFGTVGVDNGIILDEFDMSCEDCWFLHVTNVYSCELSLNIVSLLFSILFLLFLFMSRLMLSLLLWIRILDPWEVDASAEWKVRK